MATHGYTLLQVDTNENPNRERPLLEALSRRVDGMIVFSRMPEQGSEWMLQLGKPLVFFGRLAHLQAPSVASDDHRGVFMLTQHLLTLGHRKFAYLGFPVSRRNEERLDGIKLCLSANRLQPVTYVVSAPTAMEGEHICSSIMLGPEHPDALICYNDLIAIGFMKQVQDLGFVLPKDISVAGFDNIQFSRHTSPPLTTVDLQSERMGVAAMQKLLAMFEGDAAIDFTSIALELILRGSTRGRKQG